MSNATPADSNRCPKCGHPLAGQSMGGLCPNCAVQVTLREESQADGGGQRSDVKGQLTEGETSCIQTASTNAPRPILGRLLFAYSLVFAVFCLWEDHRQWVAANLGKDPGRSLNEYFSEGFRAFLLAEFFFLQTVPLSMLVRRQALGSGNRSALIFYLVLGMAQFFGSVWLLLRVYDAGLWVPHFWVGAFGYVVAYAALTNMWFGLRLGRRANGELVALKLGMPSGQSRVTPVRVVHWGWLALILLIEALFCVLALSLRVHRSWTDCWTDLPLALAMVFGINLAVLSCRALFVARGDARFLYVPMLLLSFLLLLIGLDGPDNILAWILGQRETVGLEFSTLGTLDYQSLVPNTVDLLSPVAPKGILAFFGSLALLMFARVEQVTTNATPSMPPGRDKALPELGHAVAVTVVLVLLGYIMPNARTWWHAFARYNDPYHAIHITQAEYQKGFSRVDFSIDFDKLNKALRANAYVSNWSPESLTKSVFIPTGYALEVGLNDRMGVSPAGTFCVPLSTRGIRQYSLPVLSVSSIHGPINIKVFLNGYYVKGGGHTADITISNSDHFVDSIWIGTQERHVKGREAWRESDIISVKAEQVVRSNQDTTLKLGEYGRLKIAAGAFQQDCEYSCEVVVSPAIIRYWCASRSSGDDLRLAEGETLELTVPYHQWGKWQDLHFSDGNRLKRIEPAWISETERTITLKTTNIHAIYYILSDVKD